MPAEITLADSFGQAIARTIRAYGYESVLEIGSFDGLGSTQVFIEALRHAAEPRLVCLETNATRYRQLLLNTAGHPWVQCLCKPSISLASLTPTDFERDVWESPYNRLFYPHDLVRSWWIDTQAFYRHGEPGYLETNADAFDVVLVDGDEFSGYDDYRLAKSRCRCLMLDDVFHAYKCNRAHAELATDPEWRLEWSSADVRNGAAIWVRA
jgi:hypothetical protein